MKIHRSDGRVVLRVKTSFPDVKFSENRRSSFLFFFLERILLKASVRWESFMVKNCMLRWQRRLIVSPQSVFGYFRQVQYFLPLPSSVGLPLSPTKEGDTLNRRMWWIALEVRSLYQCTGFIPAQPSSQPWIGAANLCVWSIIRWGVAEALWEGCLSLCTGRVARLASFTYNQSYLGLRFSTLM